MKILLIGGGGREHAISNLLSKRHQVFLAPGNGGTATTNIQISVQAPDFQEIVLWAVQNDIDLVVPGPEIPLVDGIEGAFRKVGIACFGPSKEAARLEGSKAFSKDFMAKHGIPTAAYKVFNDYEIAKQYLEEHHGKVVIKASGLAAGKGVFLPESLEEAIGALRTIMLEASFGTAGDNVIIEERLEGEEVSVLCICDGYTIIPMPAAQDHKRAYNGDLGPNTGGMGCYAPASVYTLSLQEEVSRRVLYPTIKAMRRSGYPFVGVLYAGIILTREGPKVLEYNCRFGDPETQAILPLLSDGCDLGLILMAAARGCLDSVSVVFKDSFSCNIVAASKGYPSSYQNGFRIAIPTDLPSSVTIFHAGTKVVDQQLVTAGGRVLSVTSVKPTLSEAIAEANQIISKVEFEGRHYRTDIGHRALRMTDKVGLTYLDAGVSIDAGNLLVDKIKPFVKETRRSGAESDIGGFGGVFDLKAAGYKDPILISGTDGVGTKLKIAQMIGKHDTIGIDLVAMSVNDVLVQGAEPLFFLDYYASSKLEVSVAADVIKGIARGCLESGCALIGGETAEMPGIYRNGEYDLAGFVVGAVERADILPKLDLIKEGDVLIGLASSGVHSNGYSLVRKVVKNSGLDYSDPCPFRTAKIETLGEALLTPTRLYAKQVLPVIREGLIKSMVHITGGGFLDNIPRSLPKGFGVVIQAISWPFLPVFKWVKMIGQVADLEIARTFNCGIGMVLVVDKRDVGRVVELLKAANEVAYEIGHVVKKNVGDEDVTMINMESAWN